MYRSGYPTYALQPNSIRYNVYSPVKYHLHTIAQIVVFQLLVLSAFAEIFSDLFLFQIGMFSVTLPHLLLVVATVIALLVNRGGNLYFALLLTIITIAELIHAIIIGYVMDTEWHKSLAQFIGYGFCFVILANSKTTRQTLHKIAPWILKLAIIISLLGIAQFFLLQLDLPVFLPEDWRIKSDFDPRLNTFRYGGFSPAIGLATEPARFAVGLVAMLACLLFLDNANIIRNRGLQRSAIGLLLCATIVCISMTGVLMITSILILSSLIRIRKHVVVIIIIAAIGLMTVGSELASPIRTRILSILQGSDNSAQVRVVASLRLLFSPPENLETFMLGTGLGMENRDRETYLRIYSGASIRSLKMDGVYIHNIFTTIRFLQGWLGVILFLILLWVIFRPMLFNIQIYYPLIAFLILYQFVTGYYLTPIFWSLLALFTVLGRVLESEQRIKAPNVSII